MAKYTSTNNLPKNITIKLDKNDKNNHYNQRYIIGFLPSLLARLAWRFGISRAAREDQQFLCLGLKGANSI